jgi:hypothetical protein
MIARTVVMFVCPKCGPVPDRLPSPGRLFAIITSRDFQSFLSIEAVCERGFAELNQSHR